MISIFSTIFSLKRLAVKKDGTVPIMERITMDRTQMQFSCKLTIHPDLWDTKAVRATGRSTVALETNCMLDKMRVKITQHYQEIMDYDNFVTAEKVENAFLGLKHCFRTLMTVYIKSVGRLSLLSSFNSTLLPLLMAEVWEPSICETDRFSMSLYFSNKQANIFCYSPSRVIIGNNEVLFCNSAFVPQIVDLPKGIPINVLSLVYRE